MKISVIHRQTMGGGGDFFNSSHGPKWSKFMQIQFGLEESSQQPDVGAYTSLLTTLDRDGRWEAALGFWATTLTDGIQVGVQVEYRTRIANYLFDA